MPENLAYRNKFVKLAKRLKQLRLEYEKNGAGARDAKAKRIAAEVAARRLL